jgi:pyrroloquinoline quinone biosynthesis protein E
MTPRPYTLIAELTHRCPLACPYCSNPVQLTRTELDPAAWCKALEQAESLGVVQLHLTGGEPLLRPDLEVIAAKARELGLYTNLITSGVPLTRDRLRALADAGVDHVQISVQSTREDRADAIARARVYRQKLAVLAWVKQLGLPLTINVVMHSGNLDEVDELVTLAETYGADRLELANVQFVSWALENRSALMPSREHLESAARRAMEHKARLAGTLDILFVKPDYFGETPKACMDGWAQRFIVIAPDGTVLPCHAAAAIKTLSFERIGERSLTEIWADSPALQQYRGTDWMPEPCQSCDRRDVDHAGCRCQAFAIVGDASATDPACIHSPHHDRIDRDTSVVPVELVRRRFARA